jgi:hypothetical protein
MEKHFYKKIYIITLCNFWHRSYSWPNTQHTQKLDTEDLYILRYCRSRFFTFVFFMQKLTGISSGQNNKSCRIIHHESKKIGFTFFCDFLRNLQESGNHFYYWSSPFAAGTLERNFSLQCGPWRPGSGGPAKFRPTAGRGRPGTGGGGSLGPKGPIPGVGWGREKAGEGRRRRPGPVAAATVLFRRGRLGRGWWTGGELWWMQGKVGNSLFWCATGQRWQLCRRGGHGASGRPGERQGGRARGGGRQPRL